LSPHLVYYRTERDKLFNTKYDQPVTQQEAIGLTYFLCWRFHVPIPIIKIQNRRTCRFIYPNMIQYVKERQIIAGDVSHEFAHYLQFIKTGKTRHDKRMLVYTKKIQKYVDTYI
jgi:hypothetical protein